MQGRAPSRLRHAFHEGKPGQSQHMETTSFVQWCRSREHAAHSQGQTTLACSPSRAPSVFRRGMPYEKAVLVLSEVDRVYGSKDANTVANLDLKLHVVRAHSGGNVSLVKPEVTMRGGLAEPEHGRAVWSSMPWACEAPTRVGSTHGRQLVRKGFG